jgi:hypothetical protein
MWFVFSNNSTDLYNYRWQGGVLSPILFNVYIDTLSASLSSSQVGCSIGATYLNHLFYADDLVLLSPSPKGLQKLVDLCCVLSNSHSIVFNPKKTVCMSFLPPHCKINSSPCIILDGQRLPFRSSCKYLGVFINDHLSDDEDILRQQRSFYMRCNYLMRNFIHCSP